MSNLRRMATRSPASSRLRLVALFDPGVGWCYTADMGDGLKFEKVAVLGATGPTGRAMTHELQQRDIVVRVISRDEGHLQRAFPAAGIEKRAGDALDQGALAKAVDGCDLVVDCIGLPGERMADHPRIARSLAAAVKQAGARCLQVSSYWCYMPIVETPVSETHPRHGGPDWARLRREAEDILREAGTAILHLPDFFGPHVHTGTLQFGIQDAVAGKPMNWIGPADVKRDYVYVPDAMATAVDLMVREAAYGDDWIVPGSGPVTAREIADILSDILGQTVKVRAAGPLMLRIISLFNKDLRGFMQLVPDYVKPISYDGSKVEGLLGRQRRTDYRAALAATVRHIQGTRTRHRSPG